MRTFAADFTRFYSENIKFVLGQQPLNEQTWANFVKGLDNLGAKDLPTRNSYCNKLAF